MTDRIVDRLEGWTWLDPAAAAVSRWAGRIAPAGVLRDLASGTPTAHPVHPPLATLAIGSFSAGTLLQATRTDSRAARRMIGTGLLAAIPTLYAGASDWSFTAGAERRVGAVHAAVNDAAVACYAAAWFGQRSGRQVRATGLAMAGWCLLAAGGMLGGHLSFAMGVGVDTAAFQHLDLGWTDVAAEADVPESGAVGVRAAGTPVMLARHGGSIVALADRCTHRGGALHSGEVSCGAVQCPWHASRFSLADGRVLAGPAVRPQPTLAVRVVDGRVQVRRTEQRSLRSNPTA